MASGTQTTTTATPETTVSHPLHAASASMLFAWYTARSVLRHAFAHAAGIRCHGLLQWNQQVCSMLFDFLAECCHSGLLLLDMHAV